MAEINLDLLGRRLETIQAELRELKFGIEVDRRTMNGRFEALAAGLGHQLGEVEAKLTTRLDALETLINDRSGYVEERFDQMETRLGQIEQRFTRTEVQLARIERLLTRE